MSPSRALIAVTKDGFPRVSGDEPAVGTESTQITLFSPRERG